MWPWKCKPTLNGTQWWQTTQRWTKTARAMKSSANSKIPTGTSFSPQQANTDTSQTMDIHTPHLLRGWPFHFWRGVWVISGKKYLADWFWGQKILVRKYLGKKHWKKISFMAYNPEKKSYTVVCWGRRFYHQRFREKNFFFFAQTKSPIPAPPQKSNGQPLNRPLPEIFRI